MGDNDSSSTADSNTTMATVPFIPHSTPVIAATALALTCQDWNVLGHGDDPNVAATTDLDVAVDRLLILFLVRIVALIAHREYRKTGITVYSDLSTTTICQTALQEGISWDFSSALVSQLRLYIERIFRQYRQVSYHNFEHAYHVTISANKLLDLMLHEDASPRRTYGLKSDPLSHLAMLFSALVHDVEHQGVPNRQLVLESDRLALLYNDQSVAEQRSLAIAFAELTKDDFQTLREILFENIDEYRRFRKTVINLVLTTDIASPERTQVVKSKWKEAFGDASKKGYAKNMPVSAVQMAINRDDADDSSDATSESDDVFGDYGVPRPLTSSRSEGDYDMHRAELAFATTPMQSISDARLALPPRNQNFSYRTESSQTEEGRTRPTRRFSLPSKLSYTFDIKKAHVRLGIRRSLDLTGETIEPYMGPTARSVESPASIPEGISESEVGDPDEPDELRATVVMEQLMKAADVAPVMQGWEHMEKWSTRLFFELMASYEAGRGEDPRQGWFENQVTFLESYLLPLARRLHATRAFGDIVGPMFAQIVEENRDRWLTDGVVVTAEVTQKWIALSQSSDSK